MNVTALINSVSVMGAATYDKMKLGAYKQIYMLTYKQRCAYNPDFTACWLGGIMNVGHMYPTCHEYSRNINHRRM